MSLNERLIFKHKYAIMEATGELEELRLKEHERKQQWKPKKPEYKLDDK